MQAMLIADNPDERDILAFVLKHVGLAIGFDVSLERVKDRWLERPSELVIVAGHQMAGLIETIATWRSIAQAPLLLVTDTLPEEQVCNLLRAGADLILSRPVSPLVFSEYVLALLRRTQTVPTFILPSLALSGIKLDPSTRTVVISEDEPRHLTQLEFQLLYVLMVNRGQVVPIDVIVERVWGYTGHGSPELVRGLVSRLRRKIEPQRSSPRFVHNVPGVGYLFSLD